MSLQKQRSTMSRFLSLLVVADFLFAVGFAWDDGLDASLLEESPDRIGIIAFAGEELFDAGDETDAFSGHHTIGCVARCEEERPGPTKRVNYHMDFAVAAALREPDRLKSGPPFPSLAQRRTFPWLLSNAACFGGSEGPAPYFCAKTDLVPRESWNLKQPKLAAQLAKFLPQSTDPVCDTILADLVRVHPMATERGRKAIVNAASSQSDVVETFGKLDNEETRGLWMLMEHEDIFRAGKELHFFDFYSEGNRGRHYQTKPDLTVSRKTRT